MPKDLKSFRERLKVINKEEEDYKNSKKIVFLEEPPVCGVFWDLYPKKKDSVKIKRVITHIEENFLVNIFKDKMNLYKKASESTLRKNKALERMSKKYKIDLGALHGVQGEYYTTENEELDAVIKRLSSLRMKI